MLLVSVDDGSFVFGGVGEGVDDIEPFDVEEFVNNII